MYLAAVLIPAGFADAQTTSDHSNQMQHWSGGQTEHNDKIDPVLLQKIRPLYPNVLLQRTGENPFFSSVREIARVRTTNGKQRLVVEVGWTVPAAMVDHGSGDLLIYDDAKDTIPLVKISERSIGPGNIHLVQNQWLRFGDGPLVSLLDGKSLEYLEKHGMMTLFYGLSQDAARKALTTYMKQGRESFLKLSTVKERSDLHIRLPERVTKIEEYPSLNEDFREADFKYSPPWEGIMFFRLTPINPSDHKVILEICVEGASEGITADQVKLVVWNVLAEEPTNRPEPVDINNTNH